MKLDIRAWQVVVLTVWIAATAQAFSQVIPPEPLSGSYADISRSWEYQDVLATSYHTWPPVAGGGTYRNPIAFHNTRSVHGSPFVRYPWSPYHGYRPHTSTNMPPIVDYSVRYPDPRTVVPAIQPGFGR